MILWSWEPLTRSLNWALCFLVRTFQKYSLCPKDLGLSDVGVGLRSDIIHPSNCQQICLCIFTWFLIKPESQARSHQLPTYSSALLTEFYPHRERSAHHSNMSTHLKMQYFFLYTCSWTLRTQQNLNAAKWMQVDCWESLSFHTHLTGLRAVWIWYKFCRIIFGMPVLILPVMEPFCFFRECLWVSSSNLPFSVRGPGMGDFQLKEPEMMQFIPSLSLWRLGEVATP